MCKSFFATSRSDFHTSVGITQDERLQEEIWYAVKEYENLYEVSNLGRIRSLPRNTTKGFMLNPDICRGYERVTLFKNGSRKRDTVHRIMAKTLLQNPDNKLYVNHKNGIKSDNLVLSDL